MRSVLQQPHPDNAAGTGISATHLDVLAGSWQEIFEHLGLETEKVPGGVAGQPALLVGSGPSSLVVVIGAGLATSELSVWYEQRAAACLTADGWDHDVLVVGAKALVTGDQPRRSTGKGGDEPVAGWFGQFRDGTWRWGPGAWASCPQCRAFSVYSLWHSSLCCPCGHLAGPHRELACPSSLPTGMLSGGWDAYAVASVAACESHAMLVGLPSPVQDEADKAPADWAERLVDAVVGTASCIAYLHDVCRDLAEQTGIEPAKVEAALMGWAADGLLRVHLPVVALCHGKLANHRARAIYIARTAQSRSVIDA